ncbi:MAG: GGDEF domain-containing protein [Sphingomonadales bacterium 32-68-7]|nr:MAG: GGDEF domain-containing protein [Sphingomonadales bacterium 12-68-11]OYX07470.1 MAG: GGDEF domain-containing protein [Sphingomonadales bacterium 32-68-7]
MLQAFEEAEIGWFWATDADNRVVYLSQSAADKLAPGREILGAPLVTLIEPVGGEEEDRERPLSFVLGAHGRMTDLTVRVAGRNGEMYWSVTGHPQFDASQEFQGYRGSAKDITAVFEHQRDASRLSQYDSLTGLANRHRMTKRLAAILTAYRAAKRSCALLTLDLDRFKEVNDTLGHPAGDELLIQVAQRLTRIVPANAELGRMGGDEFQVVIPDLDDRGALGDLAQRLIQMVSQPYALGQDRAVIGTSIGVAIAPYDGIEPDELVKSADLALYAAKSNGRGQYRFYSNDLKDTADERRGIEEDLRDALTRGEFEMHYQPVVRASDNMVVAFEALMRWNHPQRGPISPTVFIPIAEETGLINVIGEWALLRACEDAAQWPGDLRVAVNVSATQFSFDGLPRLINAAVIAAGLEPHRLELEITESVFMGDAFAVDRMFARLKKIGVKLSLDDFGTGYSSLSYLRKAPFDKIKIDQGFVRGCTDKDNPASAIITAIVSLANALRMETTAEGVEALDELAMVAQLGASSVQGFVFSGAVPQEQVLAKLGSGDFHYEAVGPARYRADRRSLLRTAGAIHEDHRYEVLLRNLSRTGALIEGMLEVPEGTELVLDLGEGQLAVARVRRSDGSVQGLEFETPLISDGADGLCTRHRISPYLLAAAGMPLRALPAGAQSLPAQPNAPASRPRFMQVVSGSGNARAA